MERADNSDVNWKLFNYAKKLKHNDFILSFSCLLIFNLQLIFKIIISKQVTRIHLKLIISKDNCVRIVENFTNFNKARRLVIFYYYKVYNKLLSTTFVQ